MSEQSTQQPQPGAHLAAVFSERAAPLDPAEARLVLDTLLRLFELGALVFEDGDGPHLYNMGASKYSQAGEQ